MLSLQECRKILGNAEAGLSDEELVRLRAAMYGLADISLRMFNRQRERKARTEGQHESECSA